jgi:hypothetical protein
VEAVVGWAAGFDSAAVGCAAGFVTAAVGAAGVLVAGAGGAHAWMRPAEATRPRVCKKPRRVINVSRR